MADFDLIIRNGTIIDGTGLPRFKADIGVIGQRISEIGQLSQATAEQDINASGLMVSPGFIDSHTHDDRYLLQDPAMPAKLSQGVTTVVTGNCGISLAPWLPKANASVPPPQNLLGNNPSDYRFATFASYINELETRRPSINSASLVGHTTLRISAMSDLSRSANEAELTQMRAMLDEAMRSGAIGLSTGAAYPAAMPATTQEMVATAEMLRPYGGVYASHIRDEADAIFPALDETFEIGRAGNANTVVSHHKLIGPRNHGKSFITLKHICNAACSQPIALDCYPYTAGSTILRKDRIPVSSRVLITRSIPHPEFAGMDLAEIASQLGVSQEDAVDQLLPAGAIYFLMDEQDVQRILAFPKTMIGSDGMPHDQAPHPRLWGTFARVLGHYSRDLGLFPLETAVHKMTGLTANHFKLPGRGIIAPGFFADITIFDAATITDRATWEEPCRPSNGVHQVLVNGTLAWSNGKAYDIHHGSVIRLTDPAPPTPQNSSQTPL